MSRKICAVLALLAVTVTISSGPGYGHSSARSQGQNEIRHHRAGYPTPEEAGFHNAALLYHQNTARTVEDLQRWVAERSDDNRPVRDGWLFDAFVELSFEAPSGEHTDYGNTNAADWLGLLDWWFGAGDDPGELARLDEAIARTAAETATDGQPMGGPPSKRRVMIEIPWASPQVTDFGVVDGQPADLSRIEDRARVVGWYTREFKARFTAADYDNLELWGGYFMREDIIKADEEWMTRSTAQVHGEGLRTMWIPYWSAPGWDRPRDFGLDVAIVQPGAAFRGPLDGGRSNGSRIRAMARQAAEHGLGVEIEARGGGASEREHRMLRQYLAEGGRSGYQAGASAWFVGWDPTPMTPGNRAYDDVVAYLQGERISDDDLRPRWTWRRGEAESTFAARDDLTAVRVELDETLGQPWLGQVTVDARTADGWEPAGWAWRMTQEPLDGRLQSIVLPLDDLSGVRGLRVRFATQSGRLNVTGIVGDTAWVEGRSSLAAGARYNTVASAPPTGRYPDSTTATWTGFGSGKLNDGQWSNSGWESGKQIGWFRVPGDVQISFDLGSVQPVDSIRLRTHGGTHKGSNWPREAGALLTTDCEIRDPAGRGARPCSGAYAAASDPHVTDESGPFGTDQSGYLDMTPPAGSSARWVTFTLAGNGWMFLDEIEILSGGRNVAPDATYHLTSAPTPADPQYSDNGTRLTDGRIASPAAPAMLTGWTQTANETVSLDLGGVRDISEVTAWASVYEPWGIEQPAVIGMETSTDGTTWVAMDNATAPTVTLPHALGFRVTVPTRPARWVRLQIPAGSQSWAWHMLSEIEVR